MKKEQEFFKDWKNEEYSAKVPEGKQEYFKVPKEVVEDLKRQILNDLIEPYRKACKRFMKLRHDSSFRTELEDLQEISDYAKGHYGEYINYEDAHLKIIKDGFTIFWNNRKYNGGWK
jgi:hypothetical protein|tara:strand:+ start:328 stop:678 length:351 start_codon:yes stop_codon:yes gene_type:complete